MAIRILIRVTIAAVLLAGAILVVRSSEFRQLISFRPSLSIEMQDLVRSRSEELDQLHGDVVANRTQWPSLIITDELLNIYRFDGNFAQLAKALRADGFQVWAGEHVLNGVLNGTPQEGWFLSYFRHVSEYLPPKKYPVKLWVKLGYFPGREAAGIQISASISVLVDFI